jgi:hypothetical protein
MIDHPPRSRNGDRCAPHCGDAADILPVFMQPCRVSVAVRYVVRGRTRAQISENRTADRKDQQAATGRGRDKRGLPRRQPSRWRDLAFAGQVGRSWGRHLQFCQ